MNSRYHHEDIPPELWDAIDEYLEDPEGEYEHG
jgi:hypothetical protein